MAKTFEDGTIHKAERTVTIENGTLYVDITASPLKDSTGKNKAVIEIVRDITELKNMNTSLKDKVRELEEFYDVAVSRELKMIELKKEIEKLKSELFQ